MNVPKESIPVKPSRFGFTAPKEEAGQRHQAPRPSSHGRPPQRHDRPQGGRPDARPHGQGGFQPSHSRSPQRQSEGRGFQGGHRDSQSRDFHPKNRHPDGRHQQRSEQHRDKFQRPQEGVRDNTPFNEDDGKQPLSNESRNWGKPANFIQRIGRKFMGGDRSRPSNRNFSRDDRQGFRKEGGFGGGVGKPHHRPSQGQHPHRFEKRSGEQRPFSGEHRNRPESGFGDASGTPHRRPQGEQRNREYRPEGGNRPHRPGGNFRPKGGFKRPGEGNSRPGGFRPR